MSDLLNRYLRPREGWLALALLVVMLLSVGWSVQRTEWIEQTEFLVPIALYGAVLGALLGLTRLSVVAVIPISAVVGTGLLLWAIGGEYFPDGRYPCSALLTISSFARPGIMIEIQGVAVI